MTDDDEPTPIEDAEAQKERTTALHLLSAIRTRADLDKLVWAGVTEDCFAPWDNYSEAYRYIVGRVEKGHVPSRVDVANKYKVQLLIGATDVMAYVEDVMDAHYERLTSAALEQLSEDVEKKSILAAIDLLRERLPINLALANARQTGIVSGGDDWVDVPEPPRWVVKPILPENWPTFIYGAGGSGKSYMAIYLAMCVATGHNFFLWPAARKRVLYLDWEMDSDIFWKRVAFISTGMGVGEIRKDRKTRRKQIQVEGLYYKPLEGSLEQCLMDIISYIIDKQIEVVIIDSFGAAMGASNEMNESRAMLTCMANIFRIPGSKFIVDHIGKQGQGRDGPFGSVYKMNSARWAWWVRGVSDPDDLEPGTYMRWENTKFNILSRQSEQYFHLGWKAVPDDDDEFVWTGKWISAEHAPEELTEGDKKKARAPRAHSPTTQAIRDFIYYRKTCTVPEIKAAFAHLGNSVGTSIERALKALDNDNSIRIDHDKSQHRIINARPPTVDLKTDTVSLDSDEATRRDL